jgi:glycerol-3-phosphate dehydrogenase subunit C
MTKCPYVPPHEWNLDFPAPDAARQGHQVQEGRGRRGEKLLASTDVHGQFAGIPIVVQVVNAVNKHQAARLMDSQLGVHPDAWMPALATAALPLGRAMSNARHAVRQRPAHTGQGGHLRHLLRQLQRARHRPRPAQAAGPQRDPLRDRRARNNAAACPSSNWATWRRRRHKAANIPVLARYAREGYAIVTPCPAAR